MANHTGSLWLTRSYNLIDKDPEIDVFRTVFQKEPIKESELAILAGLAIATVSNMFGGKTKRPQHGTFAKMAGAMGYTYGLTRDERPNYPTLIPIAKKQYADHRAAQFLARSKAKKTSARKRRKKNGK